MRPERLRYLRFFLGLLGGMIVSLTITLSLSDPYTDPPTHDLVEGRHVEGDVNARHVKSTPTRGKVFIGVLTAEKFLETRAEACAKTWARTLLPNDLQFFCHLSDDTVGEDHSGSVRQSIVNLADAPDDVYPPQKKSFRMLQYICVHHIDNYDWFVRADDDVYIKTNELINYLDTLDKNKPLYMGQVGYGIQSERATLGLNGRTYCMGGSAVVLSRPALLGMCPHLGQCLKSVVSRWDDVELGRCVIKHLGVECTAPNDKKLFHHAYAREDEEPPYHPYQGDLTGDTDFQSAITLHPVKQPALMYNIHLHYLAGLIQQKQKVIEATQSRLRRAMSMSPTNRQAGAPWDPSNYKIGVERTGWWYFNQSHIWHDTENAGRKIELLENSEYKIPIEKALAEALRQMEVQDKQPVRLHAFSGIQRTYITSEYIMDLVLSHPGTAAEHNENPNPTRTDDLQKKRFKRKVHLKQSLGVPKIQTEWEKKLRDKDSIIIVIPTASSDHTVRQHQAGLEEQFSKTRVHGKCGAQPKVSVVLLVEGIKDGGDYKTATAPQLMRLRGACNVHLYTWKRVGVGGVFRFTQWLLRQPTMADNPLTAIACIGDTRIVLTHDLVKSISRFVKPGITIRYHVPTLFGDGSLGHSDTSAAIACTYGRGQDHLYELSVEFSEK